ncbi:OST-HTH/LOTUS domain-containing protein [Nonomuraea typhae]|uniref:OST-HTH/LOTUS domain-containing protein n=1 Tax=Nonomuraea typhae TaxID=2603600 RepID=UPI001FE9DEA6|nr:OST-HTH/LOTUS domain-containing protein [Nonomuraea typhae]
MEAYSDDDGWAGLTNIGHIITKQQPDFDARTYGYAKLSDLIAATALFELDRRTLGDGKPAVIYARDQRYQGKGTHGYRPARPVGDGQHVNVLLAGERSVRTASPSRSPYGAGRGWCGRPPSPAGTGRRCSCCAGRQRAGGGALRCVVRPGGALVSA